MKLYIQNPSTDKLEKSDLANAYSAAVTAIQVRNNDRFQNNQKILLGEMGNERTEMVTIGASGVNANGTDLTVSSTLFPHNSDDPVYAIKYDQVKFYRSTTGIDGSYNPLATVNVDVDNANMQTMYDDLAGLSSYYYKVSFYSTFDSTESDLSDPIAGSGYPVGTAGALVNEFFSEVGDTQQQIMTVDEVLALMNEVNDDLTSQSRRPYRFLKTSALLNVTANNNRIALPTTLLKFDRLAFTNAWLQRTDDYRRISMEEMEYINYDNTFYPDDNLMYVSIDETTNELVMFPKPYTSSTGSIKIYFWKKFSRITSMASAVETPNTRIYKMFLLARYWRKRAIKEQSYLNLSDRFMSDYNTEIVKLQRMNRLDMGTPMSFKPDTRTSGGMRRI